MVASRNTLHSLLIEQIGGVQVAYEHRDAVAFERCRQLIRFRPQRVLQSADRRPICGTSRLIGARRGDSTRGRRPLPPRPSGALSRDDPYRPHDGRAIAAHASASSAIMATNSRNVTSPSPSRTHRASAARLGGAVLTRRVVVALAV